MAEILICIQCGKPINLEIDIVRDENNIYCPYCNQKLG